MSETDDIPQRSPRGDFYHHGAISKLFPSNNMGLVRTESGREVPFSFELVTMVGEVKSPSDLREGQEVGYDLGWTSDGLRITKIKTYPDSGGGSDRKDLEGQGGQSEDLPT